VSVAKLSTSWAVGVAAVLSFLLMIFGPTMIDFITVTPAVREVAKDYVNWAALAPLIGVWCFQLDGIFIGATATSAMRNSMLLSTFLFFITWIFLERFGNLGLWIALLSHFVYRAITLYLRLPNVIRSIDL
jgi:MATE family multidrug resistance protein